MTLLCTLIHAFFHGNIQEPFLCIALLRGLYCNARFAFLTATPLGRRGDDPRLRITPL